MLSAWRALARNPGLVHTTPISLPFRPYHFFRRQQPKFDIFKSDPTRIRKSIDAILQYRGKKQKLLVRPDGYMRATDVLRSLNWHNTTLEDFQRYARTKTRGVYEFALEPDVFNATEKDRKLLWIRRTAHLQRQLSDLVQFRILDHKHLPMAIYKAPRKEWPELRTNGIRPGTRQALVKLSPLEYVEENTDPVETSFVYINLDVEKALKGGVDFYKTRRRHIVTPGDSTGVIKPEYYKDVTFVSVDQEFLT